METECLGAGNSHQNSTFLGGSLALSCQAPNIKVFEIQVKKLSVSASLKKVTIIGKERKVLKIGQDTYPQTQMTMQFPQSVKKIISFWGKDTSMERLRVHGEPTRFLQRRQHEEGSLRGSWIESQYSLCEGLSGRDLGV